MPRSATVRRVLDRNLTGGERLSVTIVGQNDGNVNERRFNEGDDYIYLHGIDGNDYELCAGDLESIEVLPPLEPPVGSVVFAAGEAWINKTTCWQATDGRQTHWDGLIMNSDLEVLKSAE